MATEVSPLAVPLTELPALGGVRLAAAEAGIRYKGRTDVVMMEVPSGSTVAGVFHLQQVSGRAGGLVPRGAERWAGADGRGERGQCQCVHRQGGPGCLCRDGGGGGQAGGLSAAAGVRGLDRRDRGGPAA